MHFDGTVTLGNICTIVAVIGAAAFFFDRMDLKVKLHDKWIEDHAACNKAQIDILAEVRRDLAYLRGVSDAQAQHVDSKERHA